MLSLAIPHWQQPLPADPNALLHSSVNPAAEFDKYPPAHLADHRRMSEPALYASDHHRYLPAFAFNAPAVRTPALFRGASTSALDYPPRPRDHPEDLFHSARTDGLDEPISPLQPNFSGSLVGSPSHPMHYPNDNNYGPSPPGTGTSTSSSVAPLSALDGPASPGHRFSHRLQPEPDRKTYSFVALPGNAVKKRPRRRYDEIERLYQCSWPDCNKSYGTLNHLNAHVTMQKHGSKRSPAEFKELRKQWRKAKKEQEVAALASRRDSFSEGYDDLSGFNHRYLHQQAHPGMRPHHHHHQGMSLPSSVTIGTQERYSVSVDDIRYPPHEPHERDDPSSSASTAGGMGAYDTSAAASSSSAQRYAHGAGGMPASWHGTSSLRQDDGPLYAPSSLPALQHHAHAQMHPHAHPHGQIGMGPERITSPRGLPQNSTLLTPLPGYSHHPQHPHAQSHHQQQQQMHHPHADTGHNRHSGYLDDYALYEDGGRPGTGHSHVSVGGHGHARDEFGFEHAQS